MAATTRAKVFLRGEHSPIRPISPVLICMTRGIFYGWFAPEPLSWSLPLANHQKRGDKVRQRNDISTYSSPPSLSSSSLNSASCSSRSLPSHYEASLAPPSPSSATGGPAVLPTFVVARKSRIAWLHRTKKKKKKKGVRLAGTLYRFMISRPTRVATSHSGFHKCTATRWRMGGRSRQPAIRTTTASSG